jgi:microsomal epoxide hydrolase
MRSKTAILLVSLFLFTCAGEAQEKIGEPIAIQSAFSTTRSGIRIHYLESGNARSHRALILLPGWRLPAYLWDEQLSTFGRTNRVIAIDPRSQGESTKTSGGNTPEARAGDLHDVLMNLRVSRCVLVGWSQAAQDVASYLQQFGTGSIAGIVFVDSPVSAGPAEIDVNRGFSETILAGMSMYERHPREYSSGMIHSIFKLPHPNIDMQKLVNFTLLTPTDTGVAMLAMDIFGRDRRPALAKIDKPTLVIASAESPLLADQKAMAAAIPGAKFVVIQDAAHAVFVDQPANFDRTLQAFLQALPGWRAQREKNPQ